MHVHTLTCTHTQTHKENYLCITYNIYSLACLCTPILLTMCFESENFKLSNIISNFFLKIVSLDARVKCLARIVPVMLKKKKKNHFPIDHNISVQIFLYLTFIAIDSYVIKYM